MDASNLAEQKSDHSGNNSANEVAIVIPLDNLKCPVTLDIFFDPVLAAPCGHFLEREIAKGQGRCPLCKEDVVLYAEASEKKGQVDQVLKMKPELYADIYFNHDQFTAIVRKGLFKTPVGERFIAILENTANHLNDKAVYLMQKNEEEVELVKGESPVEVLASCHHGRNFLRENEKVQSLIHADNLQLEVAGKTIAEWLLLPKETIEIKAEVKEPKRKKKVRRPRQPLPPAALFAASPANRLMAQPANIVDSVCRRTVYGKESRVQEMIEVNPTLIFVKDTVTDHVGRELDHASPYQIALRCGDMEMAKMIKRVALASIIPNVQERLDEQYVEVFPYGYDAHLHEQQENTFDFSAIKNAIYGARYNHGDLQAALNNENNGSRLCRELDAFRNLFAAHSLSEKVYNPNHLHKAFEIYNLNFDRWYWSQQIVFWRQVIGYVQRYMPLCYMQAFCQGLYNLTEKNPCDVLVRNDSCIYDISHYRITLSDLDSNPNCRLGFDFAVDSYFVASARGFMRAGYSDPTAMRVHAYKSCVAQKHQNCRAYAPRTPSPRAPNVFSRVRGLLR